MPRSGRPKAVLVLTEEEREQLTRWARRAKSSQALALRSRIVLACADGVDNKTVAARMGCSTATVGKWRARVRGGPAGRAGRRAASGPAADDNRRSGRGRGGGHAGIHAGNATHWSRAKMAQRSGLSKSTIGRIWRAFELEPHRADGFKLSTDPLFVEKVYDVVGLYLDPPESAVVLCVDEKSQVQALARSQPALPMMPGMPEKRTHDYVRHGTTSLFAAINITDGTVISATHRRHRAIEFRKFLAKIDTEVPADLDVHLVCDNYATHKHPTVDPWLAHPRFHMHYTPTYSSWINQVERCSPKSPRTPPTRRPPQRPSPRSRPPRLGQGLERQPQTIHLDQDGRPDPRITQPTTSTNYRRGTLGTSSPSSPFSPSPEPVPAAAARRADGGLDLDDPGYDPRPRGADDRGDRHDRDHHDRRSLGYPAHPFPSKTWRAQGTCWWCGAAPHPTVGRCATPSAMPADNRPATLMTSYATWWTPAPTAPSPWASTAGALGPGYGWRCWPPASDSRSTRISAATILGAVRRPRGAAAPLGISDHRRGLSQPYWPSIDVADDYPVLTLDAPYGGGTLAQLTRRPARYRHRARRQMPPARVLAAPRGPCRFCRDGYALECAPGICAGSGLLLPAPRRTTSRWMATSARSRDRDMDAQSWRLVRHPDCPLSGANHTHGVPRGRWCRIKRWSAAVGAGAATTGWLLAPGLSL